MERFSTLRFLTCLSCKSANWSKMISLLYCICFKAPSTASPIAVILCEIMGTLLPSKVRYWIRLFNIKWKTVLIFSKWLGQLCNYIFHALQNGALAHYKGVWCVTAMSELHSSLATQLILRHQQPFYYLGKSNKYFRFYLVSHAQVS